MKRVGYIRVRYPEIRCVINRGKKEWKYVRSGRFHEFVLLAQRACEIFVERVLRCPVKTNWDIRAIYKPIFSPKVDVVHTFNTVCDMDTPWVSTFETVIPRTRQTCESGNTEPNQVTKHGFELLLQDSCLALVALSESNKNIQISMMDAMQIPGREEIAKKIVVCPPPQPVLITEEELAKKFDNIHERVEILFVGGLFFRKGGAQVVDALTDLKEKYPNIHLTVVSTLQYGDNASQATLQDKEKYLEILTTSDWITYYEKLPNSEVLELCKKAHLGLLPTFADTYGYAVLEMQSCGCPVITTDVRALPEMNNTKCGYIISVPKHASTEAKYDTPEDIENLKKAVYDGLHSIFQDVLKNPDSLRIKAEEAVLKIRKEHSPEGYAGFLADIYSCDRRK